LSQILNDNRQFTDNIPDVQYGPNSLIYNVILWGGADWDVDDMKDYWQPGKEGVQQIYAEYQRYNNPWFMAQEWLRGHYKTDIYGQTALNWNIAKGLDFKLRTAITTYGICSAMKNSRTLLLFTDVKRHVAITVKTSAPCSKTTRTLISALTATSPIISA
jgi:hypothetical protein